MKSSVIPNRLILIIGLSIILFSCCERNQRGDEFKIKEIKNADKKEGYELRDNKDGESDLENKL
jgi:hypothetical protein